MSDKFNDIETRIQNFWTEVFPVVRGLRSTGIVEIPADDVPYFREYLDSTGICYMLVTAGELNEERTRRGKDLLRNFLHENLFYIGDEMRKVRTLLEGDRDNDFYCVGLMLGYPDCCVAAFYQRGTESVDATALKNRFPMITHIPCSENCGRTADYNRRVQRDKDQYLLKKAENQAG